VQAGDMTAACDAALLLALALEADDRLPQAHAQATEALELAQQLGDQILLLRVQISLLRVGRRLRQPAQELAGLVEQLNALLETDTLRSLRRRSALLRELLAELADRNPRLLRVGIEVLGVDLPSLGAAGELAITLEFWAAHAPVAAADVARAFGVEARSSSFLPTSAEWTDWLWKSGSDTNSQLLLSLLRAVPPASHVLVRLAELYRREVQRRIARGAAPRAL
jgi:hypothetical protein